MHEWRDETLADYQRKGFASRSGYGNRPALVVVDYSNGFTDPTSPLGGDFTPQLEVTAQLLEAFRSAGLPVFFTTVVYDLLPRDAGVFIRKVPALGILRRGSPAVAIDPRIAPRFDEPVVEKHYASAFFGTDIDAGLKGRGVDTVVLAGCTTSGCIRASAIDSMQYGYLTIVVRDAVGDRAPGPHEANLFDIHAKYGDVVPSLEVLDYVKGLVAAGGPAVHAHDSFQRWWRGVA